MPAFFVFFFLVIVIIIIVSIFGSLRNNRFKKEVVASFLEEVINLETYGYTNGFDRKRIFETKLVNRGSDYHSSDYIKGRYQGVDFEFANVKIEDTYTVDEQTHTDTYFVGQWLILKPTQKINQQLYVVDRDFRYASPHRQGFFAKKVLEKVNTESIGFNKEFSVYATDPQEAFYILKPNRILDFVDRHRENVSFYLNQEELHIAIYTNRYILQHKLFSSESETETKSRLRKELETALSYMKILD